MEPLVYLLLGMLAFVAAASGDYFETRYVRAVQRNDSETAARCSVAMFAVGAFTLVAIIEAGSWIVAPEAAGLYVGTKLAMR